MIIKPRLCEFSDSMIPVLEMNEFYSMESVDIADASIPYAWSNSVITLDGVMHFNGGSQISDIALSGVSDNSAADYRLLNFGWAMADAVLFSGQILRDEPDTSCQIKFNDIISFRKSIGKTTDHPIQIIISKECNFPINHQVFSSDLQIIILTTVKGVLNINSMKNVSIIVIGEGETLYHALQRLKNEYNIHVIEIK